MAPSPRRVVRIRARTSVTPVRPGLDAGRPSAKAGDGWPRLTHVDRRGAARMVDVGAKAETARRALAEGFVSLSKAALALVRANAIEKGDVLGTARIAGIAAVKRTADLIPLCHPLRIDGVRLDLDLVPGGVRIRAEVRARDRTGVEMEALTAVAVAALTVYDMTKAVDKGGELLSIRLLEKDGGKSGPWRRLADGGGGALARRRRGGARGQ